jgi:hypothetical protein
MEDKFGFMSDKIIALDPIEYAKQIASKESYFAKDYIKSKDQDSDKKESEIKYQNESGK